MESMVDILTKLRITLFFISFIFFTGSLGQTNNVQHFPRNILKLFTSKSLYDFLENKKGEYEDYWQENLEIKNIEEKVKFQLFTKLNPQGQFLNHSGQLNISNFLKNVPMKFVTHGWRSAGTGDVCQSIKNQYLSNGDANVFIVHWDRIAFSTLYLFVIRKLRFVADFYANFLEEFIEVHNVPPENIHLIGHSLGAHLSGMVGKRLKAKNITIGRITGLDPALPGYQGYVELEKLSSSDAAFVDVIHTCGCGYGIMHPIGHVDFYPNGGLYPMPGCERSWSRSVCSHSRSWEYFCESIVHPFLAVKCDSFESFRNGSCSDEIIELGTNTPTNARGSYYFSTGESFPYSLGKNGTTYIPPPEVNDTMWSSKVLDDLIIFHFGCSDNKKE